jgi:hypothetical protein
MDIIPLASTIFTDAISFYQSSVDINKIHLHCPPHLVLLPMSLGYFVEFALIAFENDLQ